RIAVNNIIVKTNGETETVNVEVRPMTELGKDTGLFVVQFFEQQPRPAEVRPAAPPPVAPAGAESLIDQLENELRATREHLQTTIEELETSNEELLSMNEELQSSNEELQTSKEELQSINEELQTVNAELRKKVEDLDRSNSDMENLFAGTSIATIFLDRQLRIKRFTAASVEIFHSIESDIGRPITHLAQRIEDGAIANDVKEVLRTLATRERAVRRPEDNRWFMMRIVPYRTVDNVI